MFRLYLRVLELLGKEARLGWILAVGNLLLATAQFAEPVLFGKIVDTLSGKPAAGAFGSSSASPTPLGWAGVGLVSVAGKPAAGPCGSSSAWPMLLAWAGFGLFTIACGAWVALQADRLAHRQRQAVLTSYFEHILQFPLTFHSRTHSGRLMKV